MILPIVAYGDPVLRKMGVDIDKDYPNLQQLIADMFDTMNNALGVGLAAPQVGRAIRLFIVDTKPFAERDEDDEDDDEFTPEERSQLEEFKRVFINARIVDETGEEWAFNEGCLSIPKIREDVMRKPKVRIKYVDENFKEHDEVHEGLIARVIQHEYDHIEGKLFTDKISPLRRRMIQGKLNDISKGKVQIGYKMRFPVK
ncbi:MAG: peptide deformylase [Bacteroidetes bacterium]|jgi:peptide deformylase|nr:peptide deformylase [Bacteroidota bacterium]